MSTRLQTPTDGADADARATVDVVRVFDTTLRDGEQAPGCSMTRVQKLQVAGQLARLGVDIIEAGFPAASRGEADAVLAVATEIGGLGTGRDVTICALARANAADIDACARAIAPAARPRIHTFIATSALHMAHKLRLTPSEVLARVTSAVTQARSHTNDVEFSPEDATRSDPVFLGEVLCAALDAGATTLNIPDTVGYATPEEYHRLIEVICALAQRYPGTVVSTHCHDDLGLAVANTLAGVRAGARQFECTVNALGERAGNASLEEVVMAIHTRPDIYGCRTRVNTRQITHSSRIVSACTGIAVPPNKAVVGANAFAHESGIHQDGMLKHHATYEIMTPESVGAGETRFVLGKHSGRSAVTRRLQQLGVTLADDAVDAVFDRFKTVTETIREVDDTTLLALVPTRPRTTFEKIWDAHVVQAQTTSTPAVVYVDLHLVHEVTSAQAFTELERRGLRVRHPDRTIATMDHSTPTALAASARGVLPVMDPAPRAQLEQLARNCERHGIPLYPLGDDRQGIVHVIGPELGATQPGMTIVCGDSHTSTHGAFGALAFGIGTSQVAHVLATQCVLQQRPKTLRVHVSGRLRPGVTAKDLILAIIGRVGVSGGTGHVIEYCGSAISALTMEQRMTVCNMSIEAGARAGLIAPDDVTFEYLAGREFAPTGADWDAALARWRALRSDDDAVYDSFVDIDGDAIEPMITFGTNPGMSVAIGGHVPNPASIADGGDRGALMRALAYMGFASGQPMLGTPINTVFLGSCTNSRLSDLREAAGVMRGLRVAPGVRMLVVPGSQAIKRAAEREGLDRVFLDAGAEWREAGCSMCIAMNGDQLRPGELAVSTSNRNFEGRQGPGGRTLLASPLTAAASAIAGVVADPRPACGRTLTMPSTPFVSFSSTYVVLSGENIDTDQIIPARFLTTTERHGLGAHAFHDRRYDANGNLRPDFALNAPSANGASVLVVGRNFGCGSSREHAVWALVDAGFRAVVSESFADIFRGNALGNGLLPIEVDEDVVRSLMDTAEAATPGGGDPRVVHVDINEQTLSLPGGRSIAFPVPSFAKHCLVHGVDEIDFILGAGDEIATYERRNPTRVNTIGPGAVVA